LIDVPLCVENRPRTTHKGTPITSQPSAGKPSQPGQAEPSAGKPQAAERD
jgi:hypothetical protein